MDINITIENFDEYERKLNELGQTLTDFTDALKKAGRSLVDYVSTEPFATQGRVYNKGGWQEVAPATLAYKVKHYPGNAHNILQRSGIGRNAYVFKSSKDTLEVWNLMKYMDYHQTGTSKLPQRIVLEFNKKNIQQVEEAIAKSIQEKINQVK